MEEVKDTPEVNTPPVPILPISLNYPGNGKKYEAFRKVHKGNKRMLLPEEQLNQVDIIKLYNQVVKQFNNIPYNAQSGFISELNRLLNWIKSEQDRIKKLQDEENLKKQNDNSGKTEEQGDTVSNSVVTATATDTVK